MFVESFTDPCFVQGKCSWHSSGLLLKTEKFPDFLGVQRPPAHLMLLEKPSFSFRSSTHF